MRWPVSITSQLTEIMEKEKILVVDDEEDIVELVSFNLLREGYRVSCASSGEEALRQIASEVPDLIVLDLMLPGIDGLEVAKRLKGSPSTRGVHLVMLTAKSEEADVVIGLELGADDYVTKPFSPRVLVARVKAVLRRNGEASLADKSVLQIHDMVIHRRGYKVFVNEKPVHLTSTEFGILKLFAEKPGWVYSRSAIIDAVHGMGYSVSDRSVDVQVYGLRKKLGHAGDYIESVRGVGYRLRGRA
ncbi:MAG: response regulator [Thermodesulfobacteriota bacterium]|nr:response regulator [Thermodesulfobacteriota bacterium]